MPETNRREELANFINTLEDQLEWRFDRDRFDDRVRIQKYVYLAQLFNHDLDYDFNMYLRGPYSPELAQDYYEELESNEFLEVDENFKELVEDKGPHWLEIAATILSVYKEFDEPDLDDEMNRTMIINKVGKIKNEDDIYVEKVLDEIESYM